MPRSKITLPAYLSFTKKERTGIICIGVLIILFTILPFLFPFFIKREKPDHTAFQQEIAQLNMRVDSSGYTKRDNHETESDHYASADDHYYRKPFTGELFYFDPNTLPVDGWKKLGIKERTAISIQKYIAKGGRFYKPEDIGKIWGLHKDEVSRLLPYVRIEIKQPEEYSPKVFYIKKESPGKEIIPIDINTADTSAFIALPGIGSKLANRIIAFREKLGGFYKTEQVAETYGLPDTTFQKIKVRLIMHPGQVKKLDINTATLDELKSHPYLRYQLANAIIQYRSQHGNFAAVADLKKIMLVTDDIFNKVEPYLSSK